MSVMLLALLTCLILLVARPTVDRLDARVVAEPWKAGLVGLLSQIFFLPLLLVATLVLIISIVGCAIILLYPFLFLGLIVAALVGFTAVAYRVGRLFESRFERNFSLDHGEVSLHLDAANFAAASIQITHDVALIFFRSRVLNLHDWLEQDRLCPHR